MVKGILFFLVMFFSAGAALAFGPQDFKDWKVKENYGVSMIPPGIQVRTLGIASLDFKDKPRVAIIQVTRSGRPLSWAYLHKEKLIVMGLNPKKGEYVKQPVISKHKKIIKKALKELDKKVFETPV